MEAISGIRLPDRVQKPGPCAEQRDPGTGHRLMAVSFHWRMACRGIAVAQQSSDRVSPLVLDRGSAVGIDGVLTENDVLLDGRPWPAGEVVAGSLRLPSARCQARGTGRDRAGPRELSTGCSCRSQVITGARWGWEGTRGEPLPVKSPADAYPGSNPGPATPLDPLCIT